MKKFLLTILMIFSAIAAMAQTISYTDLLVVEMDGNVIGSQETAITVEENNGTYTLSLNRFALGEGDGAILVGDIVVPGITATESNGIKTFEVEKNITITASDESGDWIGPNLGELPVNLKGEMTDSKLYCSIDLDLSESLGMVIKVVFGNALKGQTISYTDQLVVEMDGNVIGSQETTITVEDNNGTYTLSLNRFALGEGEEAMPIGDIVVTGIVATDNNGVKTFEVEQNITITTSDESGDWIGPNLGELPVNLKGEMTDSKLYCSIDLDLSESLGMVIKVVFGNTAKEYAGQLAVTIDGTTTLTQDAVVIVEKVDSTYTLSLKNLILIDGEDRMPIGDIVVTDVVMNDSNGVNLFEKDLDINITAGAGEENWLGPILGNMPAHLKGKFTNGSLYYTVHLDLTEKLGQVIDVVFGSEEKEDDNEDGDGEGDNGDEDEDNTPEEVTKESVFSFENFELDESGKFYIWYETINGKRRNWWASSNEGYKMTNQAKTPEDYPVSTDKDGFSGNCVKLKTCDTGKMGSSAKMPIAAGSVFIGEFEAKSAMTKPLEATRFGLQIASSKPLSLKGYYKYTAGEVFTDKNKNVVEGRKDSCSIYAVLYEVESGNVIPLDGSNVMTSERVVMLAELKDAGNAAEWAEFNIPFENQNGKEFSYDKLKNKEYAFTIVASSSKEGAVFEGAVGSTLYIDELIVEWEKSDLPDEGEGDNGDEEEGDKEEEPVEIKEYADQLVVEINGTASPAQKATVTFRKYNNGTYTISLDKFMLNSKTPIGDVVIEDIIMTEREGVMVFEAKKNISIKASDETKLWMGPILGELPVVVNGKILGNKLYSTLSVDLIEKMGQKINVVFGKDFEKDDVEVEETVKAYTDLLVTEVGSMTLSEQESTIVLEKNDNTYTLSLNKFVLVDGDDVTYIGNIVIPGIAITENDGIKEFETVQKLAITEGDGKEEWIGPMFDELPVTLKGRIINDKLSCLIHIDIAGLPIKIIFGGYKEEVSEDDIETVRSYTDQLVIDINGEVMEPQEATITVENENGTYTLSLNRFALGDGDEAMLIGDIVVTDITVTNKDGVKEFETEQNITIAASDDVEFWMGPNLGELPVKLKGQMTKDKLYCIIELNLEGLGLINVVFGENITGIENVVVADGIKAMFDISGRTVKEIKTPGIYIINGKKILVK